MLLVRFLQSVIVVSLVGIVVVLFQAGAASAGQVVFVADHRPPGQAGALTFDSPTALKVFQADLQSGKPDFYTFQAAKGTVLKLKLNTLRLPGQDNFRPSLALFGPGLPVPLDLERKQLPFSLPGGAGLLLSAPSSTEAMDDLKTGHVGAKPLDEGWTQGAYWERQSLINELPQDGQYFVAVFSSTDQAGQYALAVGDKAETGLREILTFPVTWTRIHLRFGDLTGPVVAGLIGLAIGLGLVGGYFRLVGRRWRVVRVIQANRQRHNLLEKRMRRQQPAKRLNRPARPARPLPYRAALPAPRILPALPMPSATLAEKETDQPLLIGSRWELLDYPPALPAPASSSNGNGNGNGHHNHSSAPILNGHHNQAEPSDGLSEWGRLHRPKTLES